MARARRRSSGSGTGTVLLVALGAVAGLTIGMAIADRLGGLDGLLGRTGSRTTRRHREDGWRGDERRSQPFDEMVDDDSELAPEAISHLHLRGRYPEPAIRASDVPRRARAMATGATPSPQEVPGAEELEARVLEVFRNDPVLAGRNIDIGADDRGRVELTGWVRDDAEVAYALTLVRGVPQVSGVLNQLAIESRVLP